MSRANLRALWGAASEVDFRDGLEAYSGYRRIMGLFADHYGFTLEATTEAFVALSPNSDYLGNLRSLASCLDGVRRGLPVEEITVSTFNACRDRAVSYLAGRVSFLDTVKGQKIRAFRENILHPYTSRAVTVDGHMIAAWFGDPEMTMKEAEFALRGMYRSRAKGFDKIAAAIRDLADCEGVAPCQAQAVLWHTRKRLNGIKYESNLEMFDRTTPEHCPPYLTKKREPVAPSPPTLNTPESCTCPFI